jgi:hypothetical protein
MGGLDEGRHASRTPLRRRLAARLGPKPPLKLGSAPAASAVVYRATSRSWWLWWPCELCGGALVPLIDHASAGSLPIPVVSGSRKDAVRVSVAPASAGHPCPGCETYLRRHSPAGVEPAVWYDTLLCDWVVQLPCEGLPAGALLPLEIYFFDANWADVYRTAADVCYGDS